MMKADKYLKALTKRIENSKVREEIMREYQNHIQDCKEALMEAGILKKSGDALKILANGELTKKLTVKANAFSEAAKAKIEAAGGKAEVV